MELCAIPSIHALDINSLIIQCVDPDMPCLSSRETKVYAERISTLIKNKLSGVVAEDCYNDGIDMVANLMCDNIDRYAKFRHVEKVMVCIQTGECLIEGLRYEY